MTGPFIGGGGCSVFDDCMFGSLTGEPSFGGGLSDLSINGMLSFCGGLFASSAFGDCLLASLSSGDPLIGGPFLIRFFFRSDRFGPFSSGEPPFDGN